MNTHKHAEIDVTPLKMYASTIICD